MTEYLGDTELIEYVEETGDGAYCRLMGWPSQTTLTTMTTQTQGTTLEAWYANTHPNAPTGLMWKPYRILKTIPLVKQTDRGHPLSSKERPQGTLRYHKDVGWHYRYLAPFRIKGKPSPPGSMKTKKTKKQEKTQAQEKS